MATPSITSRWPTCLACLRRVAQPLVVVQSRAASGSLRPRDQGVVVRLLEDIPKFGRKEAIFRVERGRMRNEWYPRKKAEYMTATRFQELGLTREDIGDRDRGYGSFMTLPDDQPAAAPEPAAPSSVLRHTSPEKSHTLLTTLVPETLTFYRKPIQASPPAAPTPAPSNAAPAQSVSPLIASANAIAQAQEPVEIDQPKEQGIFGSVSTIDIVNQIKALLVLDPEASRILLEPGHIRFVGLEENTHRVKTLGRWEVDILIAGPGSAAPSNLEPVRKTVEILPAADDNTEA
ncbi:hypothetical protein B0T22DRAFT_97390 [Podospora appendiculata]|uniref:Ribosomal protein L9 domain-containing protein n=1 Tax=Podospora appendiculata TaxID=314037 RepID=A0AAE0XKS4_9PEZI|nr:hypothetical protein B0T22DRAFT_97390 [Podospora appendiculata]